MKSEALLGKVIAHKYRLKRKLGEGSCGMVYRARHLDLGQDVALKILNPNVVHDAKAEKRFLREVHLATSFVHKFAVQLRDFGRDRELGLLYFTMDLVEGETLKDALRREGTLDEERVASLAEQVLSALEEAHQAGIVHRDIKPTNLLLTRGAGGTEEVRVLDFGLAKAAADSLARDPLVNDLTMPGARVGTLAYMSPEQAMGMELDARSDLYAVGVILYQALSGHRACFPTRATPDPLQAFLFNLTTQAPVDLRELAPHVSSGVRDVVMRALMKRPHERFSDARSFRKALQKARRRAGDAPVSDSGEVSAPASEGALPPARSARGARRASQRASAARSASAEVRPQPADAAARAAEASPRPRARAKGERAGAAQRSPSASGTGSLLARYVTRKGSGRLPPGVLPSTVDGEYLNEKDGTILVWIPPGAFRMGCERPSPEAFFPGLTLPGGVAHLGKESPAHFVKLTRGYFMARTPVTWRQYALFCRETGRRAPRGVKFARVSGFEVNDTHPVVNVSWKDARAYCAWALGRLPSEAEWEYAARGSDDRTFPWGNADVSERLCNWEGHPLYGGKATSPAGALERGFSAFGCLDMAGNVWEWTADAYGEYGAEARTDPRGPRGSSGSSSRPRVARGGSWTSPASHCHTTARYGLTPDARYNWLGFRLCREGT